MEGMMDYRHANNPTPFSKMLNNKKIKASELLAASAEPFDKACLLVLELEAENAELKRQLAEREWQPIETAPKDGTYVILSYFQSGQICWVCDGKFIHPIGWFAINGIPGVYPTHWMPLPPAPKQEEYKS